MPISRGVGTWSVVALLFGGGCQNYFIDLTPDADAGEDGHDVIVLPPPPCGNGTLDPGEECDDGNRLDGDECTSRCTAGPGDPPPGPDPATRPYVPAGAPEVLPAVSQPPVEGASASGSPFMPVAVGDGFAAVSWPRNPPDVGSPPQISTRFLAPDGTLARDDVLVGLMSGWRILLVATAARTDEVLVVVQTEFDGIWKATVSRTTGLAAAPTPLDLAPNARNPALASAGTGFALGWYDGTDTRPCEHNSPGPSRHYLRRLSLDGSSIEMGDPVVLEEPLAARTASDLATGDDDSVGLLWWRASTESDGPCTLRFGVANAELTTIADGGVVGPGISGRILAAEGSYAMAWRTTSSLGTLQLGSASFDGGAVLLASPVLNDLPFTVFAGDVELAAGDHGLVTVVGGWDAVNGLRLYFLRTDLLGRPVGLPDAVREVDSTCHQDLRCTMGPYNVVWSGDAFLVIYFVTLDLGGPTEATEMRMVRLVPET